MNFEGCRSPSFPVAEESAFFFPRAETPFLVIGLYNFRLRVILCCRPTFESTSTYGRYSSQPQLLPVQIVQNWQGTDSLACNRLGTCP